MKSRYSYEKRMDLKAWIKDTSKMIHLLKDNRKHPDNRFYPKFERPPGVWLDTLQHEYRHQHIAASMMRGKLMHQIETLPKKGSDKANNRIPPNMARVSAILEAHKNEDVRSDIENLEQIPTGGTRGPRGSAIPDQEAASMDRVG